MFQIIKASNCPILFQMAWRLVGWISCFYDLDVLDFPMALSLSQISKASKHGRRKEAKRQLHSGWQQIQYECWRWRTRRRKKCLGRFCIWQGFRWGRDDTAAALIALFVCQTILLVSWESSISPCQLLY